MWHNFHSIASLPLSNVFKNASLIASIDIYSQAMLRGMHDVAEVRFSCRPGHRFVRDKVDS